MASLAPRPEVAVKSNHHCGIVAACSVVLLALAPNLGAQEASSGKPIGAIQDWSQRQIVFSRDALAQHPDLVYREPRVLQQALQRWQVPDWGRFYPHNSMASPSSSKPASERDWSVPGLGGKLAANVFPAKFSINPQAPPDCVKDFVVFGLNIEGATGGQANLIAFDNLYVNAQGTGFCSGTAPKLYFAYNISTVAGGKITTSPVLSQDGTKIAFVEDIPANAGLGITASSILHVLTWTAGQGAIGNAAPPSSMTSVTFSATNEITSSPWIDYGADTAYVGSANGDLYQITGVFTASPTLSGPPDWPVTVSKNFALTSPVLDVIRGLVMVGSANGALYQINTSTSAVAKLQIGQTGGTTFGIIAPPIVDITNNTTFVVDADNGTSAVLVQVQTSNLQVLSTGNIGLGSTTGTKLKLYQPAFSNAYYTKPSSGLVSVCGTGSGDSTPWQYTFGFTGAVMNTPASTSQQLLISTTAQCTGWTEFYNPNINGGTDFFFFGLTEDCDAAGTAGGCVAEIVGNTQPISATAQVHSGPSGIVVDNYSLDIGASSIYFSALSQDTVYKFTQNGLQ
jgi:hypothetical protein